jgi:hypothetical protein
MALAEALNCKIFAATEKARVLKTLQVNIFKWIQISLKSNTFRARLHLQNKPIFYCGTQYMKPVLPTIPPPPPHPLFL